MGRRSFKATPLFSQACNVDQSAMAAGQTEKPARFWRVGACSLIPGSRLTCSVCVGGMKAEVWRPFFTCRCSVQIWSSNGMPSRSKCYGGWPNGETCAVSEGRSVFSDPLAVD